MIVANTNRGSEMINRAMGRATNQDLLASAKYLLAKGAHVNDVNVLAIQL